MTDILNTDTQDILESFQSAYYDQIGSRMKVGSEEFTISSAFTYVLSQYAALINKSYENQNIDTASGEFLDNIAAKYHLTRTKSVLSNPYFEGQFRFDSACGYENVTFDAGELTITVKNHTYNNYNVITAGQVSHQIRFVATEAHEDALSRSELLEALDDVKDSNNRKIFLTGFLVDSRVYGLQNVPYSMNDDEFRQYIKNNMNLYIPGIASAFESLAKLSSPDIIDSRVRTQGDTGFLAGAVDVFCKPSIYNNQDAHAVVVGNIDVPLVSTYIKDRHLDVIGQTVSSYTANKTYAVLTFTFFVSSNYNTSEYIALLRTKVKAAIGYMNNHVLGINKSFIPSSVIQYVMGPLSNLSSDPYDFGYTENDSEFTNFSKYECLPIIGLDSISNYSKVDASPNSYILIYNPTINFTFI
jgi:hypothetical protein